uniref:Uncharacterized protein n=1 Tax=Anguilla anguilla TaxID=7936 RepID=A0A0E9SMZ2_ANGAN
MVLCSFTVMVLLWFV